MTGRKLSPVWQVWVLALMAAVLSVVFFAPAHADDTPNPDSWLQEYAPGADFALPFWHRGAVVDGKQAWYWDTSTPGEVYPGYTSLFQSHEYNPLTASGIYYDSAFSLTEYQAGASYLGGQEESTPFYNLEYAQNTWLQGLYQGVVPALEDLRDFATGGGSFWDGISHLLANLTSQSFSNVLQMIGDYCVVGTLCAVNTVVWLGCKIIEGIQAVLPDIRICPEQPQANIFFQYFALFFPIGYFARLVEVIGIIILFKVTYGIILGLIKAVAY